MTNEIMSTRLPTVAILAGGLATRLYPLTEKIPKSMIEINGRPFVDYQLKSLNKCGIKKIVFCINYLGKKIIDYIEDGSAYNLDVQYSWDGEEQLGTGGSLKKAIPLLGETFYVLYGDSFLSVNYRDMYKSFLKSKQKALLSVYKNNDQWDNSNTVVENGDIVLHSKNKYDKRMKYIDYGTSILLSSVFKDQSNIFDLGHLYEELAAKGNLAAYIVTNRFFEIGSKTGLDEFSRHVDSLKNN